MTKQNSTDPDARLAFEPLVSMQLTNEEKSRFKQWVIENVNETIVPGDERNGAALVYNLIHLLRGDCKKYDYSPNQDRELRSMGFDIHSSGPMVTGEQN